MKLKKNGKIAYLFTCFFRNFSEARAIRLQKAFSSVCNSPSACF